MVDTTGFEPVFPVPKTGVLPLDDVTTEVSKLQDVTRIQRYCQRVSLVPFGVVNCWMALTTRHHRLSGVRAGTIPRFAYSKNEKYFMRWTDSNRSSPFPSRLSGQVHADWLCPDLPTDETGGHLNRVVQRSHAAPVSELLHSGASPLDVTGRSDRGFSRHTLMSGW